MIHCLEEASWAVDLVIPVPLSPARTAERGYNQAALLARPLALFSGLAYQPKGLLRCRETSTQVGLTMKERWQNVSGAFLANAPLVSGRSVLIVDDVTTSGATLQACAEALLEAGVKKVFALTLARAVQA